MKTETPARTATTEAPAKYDPAELRRRLELSPDQSDPVSKLIWSSIYGSESFEEFEESMADHISALIKAVRIARGE